MIFWHWFLEGWWKVRLIFASVKNHDNFYPNFLCMYARRLYTQDYTCTFYFPYQNKRYGLTQAKILNYQWCPTVYKIWDKFDLQHSTWLRLPAYHRSFCILISHPAQFRQRFDRRIEDPRRHREYEKNRHRNFAMHRDDNILRSYLQHRDRKLWRVRPFPWERLLVIFSITWIIRYLETHDSISFRDEAPSIFLPIKYFLRRSGGNDVWTLILPFKQLKVTQEGADASHEIIYEWCCSNVTEASAEVRLEKWDQNNPSVPPYCWTTHRLRHNERRGARINQK